jgi:hypothetical protein
MAISAHTAGKQWPSELHGPYNLPGREVGRIGRLVRQDEDNLVLAILSPMSEGSSLCMPRISSKTAMSLPDSVRMFAARRSSQSSLVIL